MAATYGHYTATAPPLRYRGLCRWREWHFGNAAVGAGAGAPGVGTGLSQGGDDASSSGMGMREVEWVKGGGGVLEEAVGRAREDSGCAAKRQLGRFPCPYLRPYIPLPTLVMPRLPSPELEGGERVFEMREDSGWGGETTIGKAEVEIGVEMDEKIEKGFGSGVVDERPVLSEVVERSIDGERAIVFEQLSFLTRLNMLMGC